MSQQPERSKKRKLKPSKPLLEQLPSAPPEHKPAGHKHHKRQHQQQQPQQEPQQEAHADALSAGNSKFARALGSTDFHTREQGLQALSRWLTHRSLVSELDMMKLWKGIYFCFWHSDKEPVQADLAERLAGLIPAMQPGMAVLYWSAMLATLRTEWFALDRHRLNKFLMLVRKFVAAVFRRLAAEDWRVSSIRSFTSGLPLTGSLITAAQGRSLGLSYHLADVWLPELRGAAGEGALPAASLAALLEPFVEVMAASGEAALVARVRESVFDALVQDLAAASAAAAGGDGSSSSDSEEDEPADMSGWAYCLELLLDAGGFAALLFERGAQQGVRARNREALYSTSKDLERLAGKRRKAEAAAAAAAAGGEAAAAAGAAGKGKQRGGKQQQQQAQQQEEEQQQQQQQQAKKAKKRALADQQRQQQQQQQQTVANGHAEPASAAAAVKHKKQTHQQQLVEAAAAAAAGAGPSSSSHKKQKKQKQQQGTPAAATAAAAAGAGASSCGKRGVKIDLKQNLYFEHGAPPPAADIRTPPRAKPKGSALKSAAVLDERGRPASAVAGSPAKRRLVTPNSVPRLKAAEFF